MSDVFYREECERDFSSLSIQPGEKDLAGFRAQCHPLASFDYEVGGGWLTVYCRDCHSPVMKFRASQYYEPKTVACSCAAKDGLVEVGYGDGMLVLWCAHCHLPVLGAEMAPRAVDFLPAVPAAQPEATPKWIN